MLEAALIALAVIVIFGLTPKAPANTTAQGQPPALPAQSRRINIPGTVAYPPQRAGFFAGFGIPLRRLADACVFRGPIRFDQLPDSVRSVLTMLRTEGTTMGPELMRFMCHGEELSADHAVYFALTVTGPQPQDTLMYAFVDRWREPRATAKP